MSNLHPETSEPIYEVYLYMGHKTCLHFLATEGRLIEIEKSIDFHGVNGGHQIQPKTFTIQFPHGIRHKINPEFVQNVEIKPYNVINLTTGVDNIVKHMKTYDIMLFGFWNGYKPEQF